jgi:multidrug transporter EmrE-like cation transporter
MLIKVLFAGLILLTVGLNTLAQTLLKLGAGQNPLNVYLLGGLLAYGVSTVFYIIVLGRFNLSMAYPIVIGLTVIATAISGATFLRESLSFPQWLGVGLMLAGLSTVALAKGI